MKRPLRFAVIGCGFMGSMHARNIARSQAEELVFCCDVNRKRARQLQQELGSGFVTDDSAVVLTDKAIDVVVIAMPQFSRWGTVPVAAGRRSRWLACEPMAGCCFPCRRGNLPGRRKRP